MKKRLLFLLCLIAAVMTTACGSGSSSKGSSRYEEILKCEGRYVQRSEDSSDTYGAELSFYEKDGNVYANIEYSGFIGTIQDGVVEDSTDSEYLYEMHPKGKITPNSEADMDFLFRFDEEKMFISWGETCEYTLTRSDGSPEDEVDQTTPYDESEIYKTIVEKIDESFSSFDHKTVYNGVQKELSIYVAVPVGTRSKMESHYDVIKESWDKTVDSMEKLGESLYTIATVGYGSKDVYAAYIYLVEEIKESNDYDESEIVLTIKNGNVIYNLGDEYDKGSYSTKQYSSGSSSSSYSSNKSNSASSSSSSSSSSSGGYASAGERNALEKAHSYLNYSAFSYSGLIDQLKYEGYSDSEAKYAVDNCGADWYEQAVKKAQQYLEYSSFSRDGLQDQLEYEGFTTDQAAYGVQQAYHQDKNTFVKKKA